MSIRIPCIKDMCGTAACRNPSGVPTAYVFQFHWATWAGDPCDPGPSFRGDDGDTAQ